MHKDEFTDRKSEIEVTYTKIIYLQSGKTECITMKKAEQPELVPLFFHLIENMNHPDEI